jgi:hypothetical protein
MIIVGCDYHPAFNKLLLWLPTLGNCNSGGWNILRWRKFCRNLATNGMKVGVGMEARGQARWFERLLAELNIELWIGDAADPRQPGSQAEDRSPGCTAHSALTAEG